MYSAYDILISAQTLADLSVANTLLKTEFGSQSHS